MDSLSLLKKLDEKMELLQKFDVVLNIGTGDGSFAEYAITKCQKVYGIDAPAAYQKHQTKLTRILEENKNIKIGQGDIYSSLPRMITKGEEVDLILNTLPLHIIQSMKALENYLPVLKDNGRVIVSIELEGHVVAVLH